MKGYTYTNSRGVTYYLKTKIAKIGRQHHDQRIYWFGKHPSLECCALPEGYHATESPNNGMPFLKRNTQKPPKATRKAKAASI